MLGGGGGIRGLGAVKSSDTLLGPQMEIGGCTILQPCANPLLPGAVGDPTPATAPFHPYVNTDPWKGVAGMRTLRRMADWVYLGVFWPRWGLEQAGKG